MTCVAVVAHFLSLNMGDRYQGTGLIQRIHDTLPAVKLIAVNSHQLETEFVSLSVDADRELGVTIQCPEHFDVDEVDAAILATGSISDDVTFVAIAERLLTSRRLKRLYVWGGFHDITDLATLDERSGRLARVLRDSRTHFFSRSWLELAVYHMFCGASRGRCAGDPVLLNAAPRRLVRQAANKRFPTLVLSGHAFCHSDQATIDQVRAVAREFSHVCCVEGVEDLTLIDRTGLSKVVLANTLESFGEFVSSASVVVTQRLHGATFAKYLSHCLPVVVWAPPQDSLSANIKFRGVAQSAPGFGMPIAHYEEHLSVAAVRQLISQPDALLRQQHELNFVEYAAMSEKTFFDIFSQIEIL